jgi:hypothetical protein
VAEGIGHLVWDGGRRVGRGAGDCVGTRMNALHGGVGENKTRMKDEGEMMNESSVRFPLFDLDFQLLIRNVQLIKIPAGERGGVAPTHTLDFLSIIRYNLYYME